MYVLNRVLEERRTAQVEEPFVKLLASADEGSLFKTLQVVPVFQIIASCRCPADV